MISPFCESNISSASISPSSEINFTSFISIERSIEDEYKCARAIFLNVACVAENEGSSYSELLRPFRSLRVDRRNKNDASMGANTVIGFCNACSLKTSPLDSRIRENFRKFLFVVIFVAIEFTHRYALGSSID